MADFLICRTRLQVSWGSHIGRGGYLDPVTVLQAQEYIPQVLAVL